MICIIKTQLGTFIGEMKGGGLSENPFSLLRPCVVDFIPVPVQGRIQGQSGVGYMRTVYAWPCALITFTNIEPLAYSIIDVEGQDSDFFKLYQKTADEAWPKKITN